MDMLAQYWGVISQSLLPQLLRLILVMSAGLLLANLFEALHWTRFLARLAFPLVRIGHMGEIAGASFALAFFSPASANALLAESYQRGDMSRKEVILANIFNSSPSFFLHLPTMLALLFSFLGPPGLIYVGVSFAAACLRTLLTAICGHFMLPGRSAPAADTGAATRIAPRDLLVKIWLRFKARMRKILLFTIPIYVLVFSMQQFGLFERARIFLAEHASILSFLKPEALGVVALSLTAELGAALSAASALGTSGALEMRDIILALLVGNILSSPIRAFRHQLPSYAGFYAPGLALQLVAINQALRAATMTLLTAVYYFAAY